MPNWQKKTQSEAHNWETGEKELEGVLIKKEAGVGPNKSLLYTIRQNNDQKVKVWGSTVLDENLEDVPLGSMVRIVYLGKKTGSGGTKFHDFEVYEDEDFAPQPETETIDIDN